MPAWSRNSPAARAASAHPSTGTPSRCHASRAESSADVLPGPGRRPHDLDAIHAGDQSDDEGPLLLAQEWPRCQCGGDRPLTSSWRQLPAALERAIDERLLRRDQVAGRVALLTDRMANRHNAITLEERVGTCFDVCRTRPRPRGLRERLNDLASRERRPVTSQAVWPLEALLHGHEIPFLKARGSPAAKHELDQAGTQTLLGSPSPPPFAQAILRHVAVLPAAGVERGDLRRPS